MCGSVHLEQVRDAMDAAIGHVREHLVQTDGWRDEVAVACAREALALTAQTINHLLGDTAGFRINEVRVNPDHRSVGYAIGDHRDDPQSTR